MVQTGCAQWRSGIAEAGRTFCGSQVRLLALEILIQPIMKPFLFSAPCVPFLRPAGCFDGACANPRERANAPAASPKPEPKVPESSTHRRHGIRGEGI